MEADIALGAAGTDEDPDARLGLQGAQTESLRRRSSGAGLMHTWRGSAMLCRPWRNAPTTSTFSVSHLLFEEVCTKIIRPKRETAGVSDRNFRRLGSAQPGRTMCALVEPSDFHTGTHRGFMPRSSGKHARWAARRAPNFSHSPTSVFGLAEEAEPHKGLLLNETSTRPRARGVGNILLALGGEAQRLLGAEIVEGHLGVVGTDLLVNGGEA